MDRQIINRTIQSYIREVEQSIHEPITYRDIGRTSLDEAKAFFLLLPLLNGEQWSVSLNTSALAVGAVHAAFDIHDKVDILDATSKEQQLMVLAGDYFSGVHYRLLASIPDFKFITAMSEAIGRINETKTDVMMEKLDSPHALISSMMCIESGCITEFHHHYSFERYTEISRIALSLIWLVKIATKDPTVQNGWRSNNVKSSDVDTAISILTTTLHVELMSASFLNPFLKQEIHKMATPLLGKTI